MEAGRAEKQTMPWSRREKTAPWRLAAAALALGRLAAPALAPVRPMPMEVGRARAGEARCGAGEAGYGGESHAAGTLFKRRKSCGEDRQKKK